MNNAKLAFIGGGNMATSLIGGLIDQGFAAGNICASDPLAENRQRLQQQFGIATTADNNQAAAGADLVVIAVKPQVMEAVAKPLAPSLAHKPVVISIAAGIPLAALKTWLGEDTPLIRCMPNTPALVRCGASGLYASPLVTEAQKKLADQVFSAVGTVAWLHNEADIDAVTALSGSGPAYYFLVMEAMENAAIALGLPPQIARQLCLQTALGAARMASESDVDPAELRRRVTSPGGTTEQAVATLMEGGLPDLFANAMIAARNRAQEMAGEYQPDASPTGHSRKGGNPAFSTQNPTPKTQNPAKGG